jgi:hypothetical protein
MLEVTRNEEIVFWNQVFLIAIIALGFLAIVLISYFKQRAWLYKNYGHTIAYVIIFGLLDFFFNDKET